MNKVAKAKFSTIDTRLAIGVAALVGIQLSGWQSAAHAAEHYQQRYLVAEAPSLTADEKLLAGKTSAIANAMAMKDTDPTAGIRSLQRYKKFSLPEVEAALLELHIAMARAYMKADEPERAHNALLPYQTQSSPVISKLLAEIAKASKKKQADTKRQELAARKRKGVEIGMTAEQVIQSNWGKPERVNRTHNARGTREQWVYPGNHNYLYFENGILVSVQN